MIDEGLIILDKPCGHVAHEITTFVKKLLKLKRAGHAGTLDPDVSGVMPIALGRDTKLLGYLAGKTKTYVCIMKIKNRSVSDEQLKKIFKEFTGLITQTPPKVSAVKKVPRKRMIYYIRFLERKDNLVLFETKVDAGTYIRTLCEDMGKKIGGARMYELRRIAVGNISEKEAVTLQDLIDAAWLAERGKPENLVNIIKNTPDYIELPKAVVKENSLESIKNGAQIMVPAVVSVQDGARKDDFVKIFSESGSFVGIGRLRVEPLNLKEHKKGLAIKIERMHLK
ncbi:MAG: RNA-guided pseudouridylation complex pseudouridine synthase subunit Cbf5 [Candidatus Bilamarchaeaceae archaeon]